jgi:hypothetical protein
MCANKRRAEAESIEKVSIVRVQTRDESATFMVPAAPRPQIDEAHYKRVLELADIALKNPKGN